MLSAILLPKEEEASQLAVSICSIEEGTFDVFIQVYLYRQKIDGKPQEIPRCYVGHYSNKLLWWQTERLGLPNRR